MSLKILPYKIHIKTLINELGLAALPLSEALPALLDYSEKDGLDLYFDEAVLSKESDTKPSPAHVHDEDFCLTAGNLSTVSGSKCIGELGYELRNDGSFANFHISSFSQKGSHYYVVMGNRGEDAHITIDYNELYVTRDDYFNFLTRMKRDGSMKQEATLGSSTEAPGQPSAQYQSKESSAEMKALALLAREMARKSERFKTGEKVNASAFKEHLLQLAEDYDVSKLGLKTIDDKINKALSKLDIKEIKKQ